MELHSYHFYNPFKSPTLWFFLNDPNNKYSNDSMSYVMDDVDLYYQPLEPQWIAIFFFFVRLTIIVFGQFIGTKVVILMKRENGILSEVTILFMITQMVFHPNIIEMVAYHYQLWLHSTLKTNVMISREIQKHYNTTLDFLTHGL